jgi:hypothetical protein
MDTAVPQMLIVIVTKPSLQAALWTLNVLLMEFKPSVFKLVAPKLLIVRQTFAILRMSVLFVKMVTVQLHMSVTSQVVNVY